MAHFNFFKICHINITKKMSMIMKHIMVFLIYMLFSSDIACVDSQTPLDVASIDIDLSNIHEANVNGDISITTNDVDLSVSIPESTPQNDITRTSPPSVPSETTAPVTMAPTSEPVTPEPTPEPSTTPPTPTPKPPSEVNVMAALVVASGQTFDGKGKRYERKYLTCNVNGQSNGNGAVFVLESGAVLKNVIIGANQIVGILCRTNDCTVENVIFDSVCKYGVVIHSGSGTSKIKGGSVREAKGPFVHLMTGGTVEISGFQMHNSLELFESCSTCGPAKRRAVIKDVKVTNPKGNTLVRLNQNYHDEVIFSSVNIRTANSTYVPCTAMIGGKIPKKASASESKQVCAYNPLDVQIIK
jgi:pectate lyase